MLGLILGQRYRSLRDAFNAFQRNPGRGDAAAKLIERAPTFGKAASIYRDFKLAGAKIGGEHVMEAIRARLYKEGPTQDTLNFLHSPKEMIERRKRYEDGDDAQFYWEVSVFVRKERE